MLGFKDANIYPFTPNVATARRLAGRQRRTAVLYTCNHSPCDRLAQIVKSEPRAIGIDVLVKTFPLDALFTRVATDGRAVRSRRGTTGSPTIPTRPTS